MRILHKNSESELRGENWCGMKGKGFFFGGGSQEWTIHLQYESKHINKMLLNWIYFHWKIHHFSNITFSHHILSFYNIGDAVPGWPSYSSLWEKYNASEDGKWGGVSVYGEKCARGKLHIMEEIILIFFHTQYSISDMCLGFMNNL